MNYHFTDNRPAVIQVPVSDIGSAESFGIVLPTQVIHTSSGSPCSPSPCGPNTECSVNNRGIALCRCIGDYVPDGNTIQGCKPQCERYI